MPRPVLQFFEHYQQKHNFVTKDDAHGEPDSTPETFDRLCKHMKWTKAERRKYRLKLSEAVSESVRSKFDCNKLESAQQVCRLLCPKEPVPQSLNAAKKMLAKVFINIFDFVDGYYNVRFANVRALAKYSKKHHKIFPKEAAKNSSVRVLLKMLF